MRRVFVDMVDLTVSLIEPPSLGEKEARTMLQVGRKPFRKGMLRRIYFSGGQVMQLSRIMCEIERIDGEIFDDEDDLINMPGLRVFGSASLANINPDPDDFGNEWDSI